MTSEANNIQIPHHGSLCRIDSNSAPLDYEYAMKIALESGGMHELQFERSHYEFMARLFAILDTESRGSVGRSAVMEFVTLRCPVFWRRDEDLRRLGSSQIGSPTFDEVWSAVTMCSHNSTQPTQGAAAATIELGVEGWMVFCRFIALAQYLEAKRRFSARHLQQTMRHRNSPRGSEVVVVDVPPPEPPTPLTPSELADYEAKVKAQLPLPELDLDHSLVAAHDAYRRSYTPSRGTSSGKVKINLFGSSASLMIPSPLTSHSGTASSKSSRRKNIEFAVTFIPTSMANYDAWSEENMVVRRSFEDMIWLNDTFTKHKELGGTLCGRILPPFPNGNNNTGKPSSLADDALTESGTVEGTKIAMAAAAAGVDMITSVAKSFWGSYVSPSSSTTSTSALAAGVTSTGNTIPKSKKKRKPVRNALSLPETYYSVNSPAGKARQLERYLNYLLEHPALSTSFPLNTILKASQSGLDAAKQSLDDYAKSLKQQQTHTPHLGDGKMSFWPSSTHAHSGGSSSSSTPTSQPNLSWVRTAAQAAMALRVHGILETTGMPSASARLQHASLPHFDNASTRKLMWAEEDGDSRGRNTGVVDSNSSIKASSVDGGSCAPTSVSESEPGESFERGVVQVESELGGDDGVEQSFDEGYDLLPDPVPAPERRILCAGSVTGEDSSHCTDGDSRASGSAKGNARFHYGGTLQRHRITQGISEEAESAYLGNFSVDEDIDKLREVIGSVDNTLSRCLTASAGIGAARRKRLRLHQDIVSGFDSWEGLRGKFISQRALLKGVSGLEQSRQVSAESDLELIDDISWQTSLASSAVSAAEDVRSTVRAARTAANAKAAADSAALAAQSVCETGTFSSIDEARAAQTRASISQSHAIHAAVVEHEANTAKRRSALALANDVKCWNVHRKRELLSTCLRSARSQLEASRRAVDAWSCLRDGYLGSTVVPFATTRRSQSSIPNQDHSNHSSVNHSSILSDKITPSSKNDFEDATATIFAQSGSGEDGESEEKPSILPVDHDLLANNECFEQDIADAFGLMDTPSQSQSHEELPQSISVPSLPESSEAEGSFHVPLTQSTQSQVEPEENEKMSASMQSLVDGLMTWGGQYDSEEDIALPSGMAASIVMEENGL